MGIPGFFGNFIQREIKQAIVNGLPPYVASLSFDLNGLLHDARKKVYGEGNQDPRFQEALLKTDPLQLELEFYNAVAAIILRMVQAVNPRDCLIFAVDGVAPGAKMQQQRGRRERAAKDRHPSEIFDRNAITPGTDFMIRLDTFLVRFITTYREYLPPKVIYSSHLVPGEGEHKIMDFYRNGEVSDGPAAQAGATHVLYGLDADLIMLSLLSPLNGIYLSRETVREVVSIDQVKQYLLTRTKSQSVIDDFVIMMFLIGNDFLPHTPALEEMSESISKLLDIYTAGNYQLSIENEYGQRHINWDSMKQFIQQVSLQENELLAQLSTKEYKYPSRFLQASLINGQFYPDTFRSLWYQNALGTKGPRDFTAAIAQIVSNYQVTEEDYMTRTAAADMTITAISPITQQRVEKMCVDYMRTMEWIYLYYREGTSAINQDWAYPYYHTPMIVDLSAVMQSVNVTRVISGYSAYFGMTPFTALHQLIAVLPMKSKDLLPIELQPLFSYNSIIRDFFPDNFIVEMDGKNKDHEGVPIVPLIDRQRVIDAVAQIPFTPERVKLWVPTDAQYFVRTADQTQDMARVAFEQKRHSDFLARQAKRREKANLNKTRGTTQQPLSPGVTHPVSPGTQQPRSSGQVFVPTMTNNATRGTRGGRGGRGGSRGGRGAKPGTQSRSGQTQIYRSPKQNVPLPTLTQPTLTQPIGKAPAPSPLGTILPPGVSIGKGPSLTPIGTALPPGLIVGKAPTVTNRAVVPTVQPVQTQASSPTPKIATTVQPVKTQARSPAQWKQLPTLM